MFNVYSSMGRWAGDKLVEHGLDPNTEIRNTSVSSLVDDAITGLENQWFQLTGQPEKTSSYQHLEEREDTAIQRQAADMEAAGLSKYQGVGPAQASSPGESNPMARAMEAQQLQSMKLANKEARHNLSVSEDLGIRTGDQNYAAKWAELGNVLFGFDPTKVDGGLVPWVFNVLKGYFGNGEDPSDPSPAPSSDLEPDYGAWRSGLTADSPVLVGASADQAASVIDGLESLVHQGPEAIESFVNGIIKKVHSSGIGKTAGYSTLPDDKSLGIVGKSLEGDIEHFASEMLMKGVGNDDAIMRVAEFIANKYNANKDDVFRKLKDMVTFVVQGP